MAAVAAVAAMAGHGALRHGNDGFAKSAFLYGGNAAYVEQLHESYRADPAPSIPNGATFSPT